MTYTFRDRKRVKDAEYRQRRKRMEYAGELFGLVDAAEASRHARSLHELGWSFDAISEFTGEQIANTTAANLVRGRYSRIERATHTAILAIPYTLAPSTAIRPETFIPTLGAARRTRALLRLGWTHRDLRENGLPTSSHLARGTYAQMRADKWQVVAAAYESLCMTLGPSPVTAQRAEQLGYAPPLAWMDIDDPDEQPILGSDHRRRDDLDEAVVLRVIAGERLPMTRAERLEVVRRLRDVRGWSEERIEQHAGITQANSQRRYPRAEEAAA